MDAYSAEVLADTPLAYWRLNELAGTTIADSSGNARGGSISNSNAETLTAPGLLTTSTDKAFNFDGANDYLGISYGAWADVTTGTTVEAWVKLDVVGTKERIIFVRYVPGGTEYLRLSVLTNGTIRFGIRTGTTTTYHDTSAVVTAGATRHVVATYDQTNVKIYLDGAQVLSVPKSGAISTGGSPVIRIGAYDSSSSQVDGTIDEVAYYDTALSAARVAAHYAAAPGPLYSVTVSSLTRGWTYTVVHGDEVDPNVSLHLTDNLTCAWSFKDEQIPGQMEPMTVGFGFAANATADLPPIELDDLLSVAVRIGTNGPLLLNLLAARVNDVDVELDPKATRAVKLQVAAVDLLADLRGRLLSRFGTGNASDIGPYRQRFAVAGAQLGRTIGVPTSWADVETPAGPAGALSYHWPEANADEFLEKLVASWSPNDIHHTVTPHYSTALTYPAGYEWCGPAGTGAGWSGVVPRTDPQTPIRFMVTPAGRKLVTAAPMPLRFAVVDGVLVTIGQATSSAERLLALSACWCRVPANARRSRDHVIDTLDLGGFESVVSEGAPGDQYFAEEWPGTEARVEVTNAAAGSPRRPRVVDTHLRLRDWTRSTDARVTIADQASNIAAVGRVFLTEQAAAEAPWTYDEFELSDHNMTQAEAEDVLPRIVPSYPGDGRDGKVVRHMTLHSLPHEIRFNGQPIVGFIVRGSLTIQGGHIVFRLSTTPGMPSPISATPITVGEVDAATYQAQPLSSIHPDITVADLAYVAA